MNEPSAELKLLKVDPHSNLIRFAEMMRLTLHLEPSEAYFQWKYLENPAGTVIAYEALDGDKPAAFYGIIPEYYWIEGKKSLIFQSMDTMTHPNYQRRGLFVKLAQRTYQEVYELYPQTPFLLGIPGSNSLPGFVNKLNWHDIAYIPYVFVSKQVWKLTSLFSKRSSLQIEQLAAFDGRFDEFQQAKPKSQWQIEKYWDAELMNWKVIRNPLYSFKAAVIKHQHQIVGYLVYHLDAQNRCRIDYLEHNQPHYFAEHLQEILRYLFAETKATFLYTWKPNDASISKIFKQVGFWENSWAKGPFSYKIPFIIHQPETWKHPVQVLNPNHYHWQPLIQD